MVKTAFVSTSLHQSLRQNIDWSGQWSATSPPSGDLHVKAARLPRLHSLSGIHLDWSTGLHALPRWNFLLFIVLAMNGLKILLVLWLSLLQAGRRMDAVQDYGSATGEENGAPSEKSAPEDIAQPYVKNSPYRFLLLSV